MDDLGIRTKLIQLAGNAVVKTRADSNNHIALVHRHIGFISAVHAQHADELLVGCRISAQTHQGIGDRKAQ